MKNNTLRILNVLNVLIVSVLLCLAAYAQSTAFTYQGSLQNGSSPASGNYDFEFRLFDAATGGAQPGSTVAVNSVPVVNGTFAVTLDFGNQFTGASRFLEIGVRTTGGGAFTTLAPRQALASAPYAVRSTSSANADNATNAVNATNATNAVNATTAATATNALQLGGVAANQYVLTGDARLSDARNPLPNSANYIQNTNSLQIPATFNISGSGTVGGTLTGLYVNSVYQYNIDGNRVLSSYGANNLFAGVNAGTTNNGGSNNAFFGFYSGFANSTGSRNSFFGDRAGFSNSVGFDNAFFGALAGRANTTGFKNSFFGSEAGYSNTDGYGNAFFGYIAGRVSTGNFNSFFGYRAGFQNTTGGNNTFLGSEAGNSNTDGGNNTFLGYGTGIRNITGFTNTLVGSYADVTTSNLNNATAIGYNASVSQSYSLILGYLADVGIGTSAPLSKLDLRGGDVYVGLTTSSGLVPSNSVYVANDSGDQLNSFRIDGFGNDLAIVARSNVGSGSGTSISFRTAAAGGGETEIVAIDQNGFYINNFGSGSTSVCRNGARIANCSSSIRYKTNINPFSSGLDLIRKLRPVSFNWKDGGMPDMGLVAEEVADAESLLVTQNDKGEVEGVKYDRLSVVFINAFKEQQTQIEAQQKTIAEQHDSIIRLQAEVKALKSLVCIQNQSAEFCKPRN